MLCAVYILSNTFSEIRTRDDWLGSYHVCDAVALFSILVNWASTVQRPLQSIWEFIFGGKRINNFLQSQIFSTIEKLWPPQSGKTSLRQIKMFSLKNKPHRLAQFSPHLSPSLKKSYFDCSVQIACSINEHSIKIKHWICEKAWVHDYP